jgi:L-gulono-1,4-lactone dehydrogenase
LVEAISRRDWLKAMASTAGVGFGSLSSGCCPGAQLSDKAWTNALQLDGVDPEERRTPTSLGELVRIVKEAEGKRKAVRMTGSGHSFSDVAFSEGYLLSPAQLTRRLDLDRTQLRAEIKNDPNLVRVESGMRLRELNPLLAGANLALSNMGGYDAQTIVGAAMTGTHGSGLGYGPIASQIVSIELVGTGGEVLKIEPKNGITDPANPTPTLSTPEGPVSARLIADDEVFNAVAVSMGCMGVVYAVVLRVEPRFWLKEVRTRTTWGELSKPGGFISRLLSHGKLDDGDGPDPDYYEIYFNPYPSHRGEPPALHRCLLTRRYKLVTPPAQLTPDDRKRGQFGSSALHAAAKLTEYGARLVDFINQHPDQISNVIDNSLGAVADPSYIDISYKVFHLGPANLVRAYGIESGFDATQTVAAAERLMTIAQGFAQKGWVHSSPPSLRFVKRSPCHLAMQYGRDTMMLEMGMLVNATGADDLLKTYETQFAKEFGARPHWGLDLKVLKNFDEVRALYPESADRWRAVYQLMNAKGTFNGSFTDRLGISINA